jgi:hypothetical protein
MISADPLFLLLAEILLRQFNHTAFLIYGNTTYTEIFSIHIQNQYRDSGKSGKAVAGPAYNLTFLIAATVGSFYPTPPAYSQDIGLHEKPA